MRLLRNMMRVKVWIIVDDTARLNLVWPLISVWYRGNNCKQKSDSETTCSTHCINETHKSIFEPLSFRASLFKLETNQLCATVNAQGAEAWLLQEVQGNHTCEVLTSIFSNALLAMVWKACTVESESRFQISEATGCAKFTISVFSNSKRCL